MVTESGDSGHRVENHGDRSEAWTVEFARPSVAGDERVERAQRHDPHRFHEVVSEQPKGNAERSWTGSERNGLRRNQVECDEKDNNSKEKDRKPQDRHYQSIDRHVEGTRVRNERPQLATGRDKPSEERAGDGGWVQVEDCEENQGNSSPRTRRCLDRSRDPSLSPQQPRPPGVGPV